MADAARAAVPLPAGEGSAAGDRSDLELMPLEKDRDEPDLVPPSTTWTAVPGLPGVRWRKSGEEFKEGTKGPLRYDVSIASG